MIGWNHFFYDFYTNKPDKVRFLCVFCRLIRHAIVPASFVRFVCGEPTEPEQTKTAAILNQSKRDSLVDIAARVIEKLKVNLRS